MGLPTRRGRDQPVLLDLPSHEVRYYPSVSGEYTIDIAVNGTSISTFPKRILLHSYQRPLLVQGMSAFNPTYVDAIKSKIVDGPPDDILNWTLVLPNIEKFSSS